MPGVMSVPHVRVLFAIDSHVLYMHLNEMATLGRTPRVHLLHTHTHAHTRTHTPPMCRGLAGLTVSVTSLPVVYFVVTLLS